MNLILVLGLFILQFLQLLLWGQFGFRLNFIHTGHHHPWGERGFGLHVVGGYLWVTHLWWPYWLLLRAWVWDNLGGVSKRWDWPWHSYVHSFLGCHNVLIFVALHEWDAHIDATANVVSRLNENDLLWLTLARYGQQYWLFDFVELNKFFILLSISYLVFHEHGVMGQQRACACKNLVLMDEPEGLGLIRDRFLSLELVAVERRINWNKI